MSRWAMPLIIVVLVVQVACSGPSTRNATSEPGPSPTAVVPATATRVVPPAPTPTLAIPSATSTPTRVPEATPTPRPSPTSTPVAAPNPVESALLAMLPSADGLPAGWSLVSSGPVRGRQAGMLLCGVDPFPGASQKLAQVEAEYQRDDARATASIIQGIVAFPEPTAIAAMAWARETITCQQWTDADGTSIVLGHFEDAGLGDESLTTTLEVAMGGGPRVAGRWYVVRKGGLIATIAYLGGDALVPGAADGVVDAAIQLLDSDRAAAAALDPDVQSALTGLLLRAGDLGPGWDKVMAGPTPATGRADVCGGDLLGGAGGQIGDVTARFAQQSSGATIEQRAAAYPAVVVTSVMETARTAMTCGEWIDPDGSVYRITPPEPANLGGEGLTASFSVDGPDGGYGAIYVIRVGAVVTTIIFRSTEPLVADNVQAMVRRAVESIQAAG